MVDSESDRALAAELEQRRDTERPESEHEALMRAIGHLTDAVLKLDRTIAGLVVEVGQCPLRPRPVAVVG